MLRASVLISALLIFSTMGYPAHKNKSEEEENDSGGDHHLETPKEDSEDITETRIRSAGSAENKATDAGVTVDGDGASSSVENAINGENETGNAKNTTDAQCTEEVSNSTSEKNDDEENGDKEPTSSIRSESGVDIESQNEMVARPTSCKSISDKPDDIAVATENFITNEGVERPERPSRSLKHDLAPNEDSCSDLESDQPDAGVLEFYVNASKNAPFRVNRAGSSIEEIEILSDGENPTSPVTKSKLNEKRKRKQDFSSRNSSSKKAKAVQIVELESDSEEATLLSRKISVSNGDTLKTGKRNKKGSKLANPVTTRRPSSSTVVTDTLEEPLRVISPLQTAASCVISSPTRGVTVLNEVGTPQPLGNTGTNFVIIRPPTAHPTEDNSSSPRPLTATDIATMIMPTADWNVNSYRQGFSISETILSSRLIEIIRRSITISNPSSQMNFSVYGQLVPQFASSMVASSVAEVQSILNRFANVSICAGIDMKQESRVGSSVSESLNAQSKFYRHVDNYYRSTECPLVLTDTANCTSDSKTSIDPKPQNNGLKLCAHCRSAKTALQNIVT